MTEIRFYHLQNQSVDSALPAIIQKAYQAGHKIVVRLSDAHEVERMNKHLWSYKADVFLPHGTKKEGHADKQPIWLTDQDENPNEAQTLILTGGTQSENIAVYSLCCEMLDGRNENAVQEARARWKDYQAANHDVTYWFQNDNGGWEKKA